MTNVPVLDSSRFRYYFVLRRWNLITLWTLLYCCENTVADFLILFDTSDHPSLLFRRVRFRVCCPATGVVYA